MQPGLPWWDADISEANSYLTGVAENLVKQGIDVSTQVVLSDNVATAILAHVSETEADLLAIATSGAGGFKRLVFGSVADEVTRESPTSLLIFHAIESAAKSDLPQGDQQKTVATA